MIIRPFQPSDLDGVRRLLEELADVLGESYDVDAASSERNAAHMTRDPETYAAYVCDAGEIAGFLSVVFYRNLFHRTGTALISELVVSERHRGRGIGAELVGRAFAEARHRGMDEIEVGVLRDNHDAIRFYRRVGFNEEYLLLGHEFT